MARREVRADSQIPASPESGVSVLRRAMTASPQLVSPQLARNLQATENAFRAMGAEFGLLTSRQVAALVGAKRLHFSTPCWTVI